MKRTGCLLHPQGSPHPQIRLWKSPQNFSFYGESICQGYNCPGKEKKLLPPKIIEIIENNFDAQLQKIYSFFAANHNFWLIFDALWEKNLRFGKDRLDLLIKIVSKYVIKFNIPVTSFEIPLKIDNNGVDKLWDLLGSLLDPGAYSDDVIQITSRGKIIGKVFQRALSSDSGGNETVNILTKQHKMN